MRKDLLLGQQEMTCEARRGASIPSNPYSSVLLTVLLVEIEIVFSSADGPSRHSTKPDTCLTVTVSTKESSSQTKAINTSNPGTTELDDSAVEGGVVRPTI
jgi:hypothetical protein